MTKKWTLLAPTVAFALGLSMSEGGKAQTATTGSQEKDTGLEEIVVTATRRETDLQKTAVAISAFSADTLKTFDMNNSQDLMAVVPNLYMQLVDRSPSTQTYGMRGLGSTDQVADPTVGIYVDDVYLPRSFGQLFDLPGINQVEVLRGPQGTLYGRNSAAGAIRYVTDEPDDQTHVKASLGLGNYDAYETHDFVSGQIADSLYGSIAGVQRTRGGYTYDATTKDWVNDLNQTAVRGKLRYVVNDKLEFGISADYEYDNSTTLNYTPLPSQTPAGYTYNPRQTYESDGTRDRVEAYGVSGKIVYKLSDQIQIKSISAFREFNARYPNYLDGLPQTNATILTAAEHEVTQEFQLLGNFSRVQFSSGLFYFHEQYNVLNQNDVSNIDRYYGGDGDLTTDSYAAYGQADIHLTDNLSATVGARYTSEDRHFAAVGYDLTPGNDVTAITYRANPTSTAGSFTPKAGLQYQWTPQLMTYLSYGKGFQAGGYSLRATSAGAANIAFGPEKVTAYEAGVKADWFDHRLRTNLTIFKNDVQGLQLTVFDPALEASTIENAGSATTKGVEAEIAVKPINSLTLSGTAGYLQAVYTNFPNASGCPAACFNAAGETLPYAPKWTADGRATWTVPLHLPGPLSISGDVQYTSPSWGDALDTPAERSQSMTLVNAFAHYQATDRLSFDANVRNLFNVIRRQYDFYIPIFNLAGQSFNPPRMYVFSVNYQF
jgi:iron complex outermembrane recepter protein